MIDKRFYYRVTLRCDYGPELAWKRIGDCTVMARNAVDARKEIIHFVAEQNKPPNPDTVRLTLAEQQHIHENWSRWVVFDIAVGEEFPHPEGKEIFWANWVDIPPPEAGGTS